MFISINSDELLLITISMKMKRYIILNNIKLNDGIEICFSAIFKRIFFIEDANYAIEICVNVEHS